MAKDTYPPVLVGGLLVLKQVSSYVGNIRDFENGVLGAKPPVFQITTYVKLSVRKVIKPGNPVEFMWQNKARVHVPRTTTEDEQRAILAAQAMKVGLAYQRDYKVEYTSVRPPMDEIRHKHMLQKAAHSNRLKIITDGEMTWHIKT